MQILRFKTDGEVKYGLVENKTISTLKQDPFIEGRIGKTDATSYVLDEVNVLIPCTPTKIVCVGLAYKAHAEELGLPVRDEPLLFSKPTTCLIADGEAIQIPRSGGRVEYEGELAVVIGKKARHIESRKAAAYIMGYTCFNDVSEREAQHEDNLVPYRAKGHDTFGPMGPVISTDIDPNNLLLETRLNGEVRQQTNTIDIIYKVPDLVSFISSIMTLLPGDVIATGTPTGSAPMQPGDIVEVFIENIGTLKNNVVAS